MNFQQVEQGNGNLVQMFGTFTEIGGLQYTPQQKAKAVCKIRDDAGVIHNVHIYQGNGQLPQPAQSNQRCQFNLSTFQGTYKNKPYTGYSGFWQGDVQVNQSTPQQPPQTPSQAPQSTNSTKDVDWDAKDLRNARMNGVNNATALICLLAEMARDSNIASTENIKKVASEYVDYIYNGLKKQGGQPNPEYLGEGGTATQTQAEQEDDIPF